MRRLRYAALARVSSREQEQEGYSLQVQVTAFEDYARETGGDLVKVICAPESAKTSSARALFAELIVFAKEAKNRVDKLLFHRVDRACRTQQDLAKLEELRSEFGIDSVFMDLKMDTSDPAGELLLTTMAGIGRFVNRQTAQRIKTSTEARVLVAGLFPGRVSYGYQNVRTSKKCSLVQVHEEHGPKVRLIFEMLADNPITVPQLRQRLYEEGVFYTAKSPKFPISKLYTILHDRAYIREIKYRGEWHACGSFPALVDRDLFTRVQARLGRKQDPNGHDLLFAGSLIQCGHCENASITGEVQKGKYIYYHCTQIDRLKEHPRVRLREEALEEQVLRMLDSLQVEAEEVKEWFAEVVRARAKEGQKRSRTRRSKLQEELTKVQTNKDQLLDLRLQQEVSQETYRRKESQLLEREHELEQLLHHEAQSQAEGGDAAIQVLELSQALKQKWVTADDAIKRNLLDLLCLNFTLEGKTLVPELRRPFNLLAEGLLVGNEGNGGGGGNRTRVLESPDNERLRVYSVVWFSSGGRPRAGFLLTRTACFSSLCPGVGIRDQSAVFVLAQPRTFRARTAANI